MTKIRYTLVLMASVVIVLAISGCTDNTPQAPQVTRTNGVEIVWSENYGSVENQNNFTVVIERIHESGWNSQISMWLEEFQPHEKKNKKIVPSNDKFFIAMKPGDAYTAMVCLSCDN